MAEGAPELVGREPELTRLERALDELGRGPPAAVLQIVGEPGIGKSRLLAEVSARAVGRGHLVFEGRAAEFEQELPFGVAVDALDAYLGSLNPVRLRGLRDDQREELARVFPALVELAQTSPAVLQHERYRAHHAVRALLELFARERPVIVALDDMHWADEASLELVSHLLRRPPRGPVLILVAFRHSQAPEKLTTPLELGQRNGASERIELQALTEVDAGELLGASVEPPLRDELFRESGGNPFYIEQLARSVARGTYAGGGTSTPDQGVPRAVLESLADELAHLSGGARVVAQAAAIAGETFEPELVARAAGVTAGEALGAIDELRGADLIRATDAPLYFRFRHPIVRFAVYESAGAGWRLAVHARCATALVARGAPATVCAYHVERSAHEGDEDAIALLSEAGHASAPRAPATAARWLQAALRLLPPGEPSRQQRLELLVPLARALGSSGQLAASRERLGEILQLLPPEMAPVRGQVIAFMSLIDHLLGRHGEARATLLPALAALPSADSAEAAALQVELAADCFFIGEWKEMREWAETARRVARAVDDRRTHAAAAALLGLSLYELGRIDEAREYLAEAREIVEALSDDELALRIDACHWLGWAEHLVDDYEHSVRHMKRGIEISRRTGQGHVLAPMTIGLVIAMTWQGRLPEAAGHAEEAVELAYLAGSDQFMAWALTMRSWVAGRMGDLPEAIAAGEEAVRVGELVTQGPYTIVAACWLADALVESGSPARGRDQLLAVVDGPELAGVEHAFRACVYDVLTRSELALGHVDAAADWARRAEKSVDGLGAPGRASFALRALGAVALARGDFDRAAELALEAVEAAGRDYRVEGARARTLAGVALAAAGRRERAVVELEAARVDLEECGARRYAEQAVRELRRLGEHVGRGGRRGRGREGVAALSAREREVAELVRDRLTNRVIAERLVLSEKTVERHLSRIFAKLGVSSRADVARALERAMSETESAAGPALLARERLPTR